MHLLKSGHFLEIKGERYSDYRAASHRTFLQLWHFPRICLCQMKMVYIVMGSAGVTFLLWALDQSNVLRSCVKLVLNLISTQLEESLLSPCNFSPNFRNRCSHIDDHYNMLLIPKIVWNSANVLLKSWRVGSISMPAHQHLNHFRDLWETTTAGPNEVLPMAMIIWNKVWVLHIIDATCLVKVRTEMCLLYFNLHILQWTYRSNADAVGNFVVSFDVVQALCCCPGSQILAVHLLVRISYSWKKTHGRENCSMEPEGSDIFISSRIMPKAIKLPSEKWIQICDILTDMSSCHHGLLQTHFQWKWPVNYGDLHKSLNSWIHIQYVWHRSLKKNYMYYTINDISTLLLDLPNTWFSSQVWGVYISIGETWLLWDGQSIEEYGCTYSSYDKTNY